MPARRKRLHRIGAHTSIAGTVARAAEEAIALGCNTLQIFSRSPRMWRAAPLDPAGVERLKALREEHDLTPLVIHGNYLTNLAAADRAIRERSIESFRAEVERALELGAEYLVIHPGSSKGQTHRKAVKTLASSLARATKGISWDGVELLLENTAGGGETLGRAFDELAEIRRVILEAADIPVGYCIDTAHSYEAGYDVSTSEGLEDAVRQIDAAIGTASVKVIHANDSKTPLGSNADRHEHIGEGYIGSSGFRRILHHPALREKPFILETPLDEKGTHQRNVDALKALARRARRKRST